MRLTFDSGRHEYKIGDIVVPSVTQILENVGLSDYEGMSPAIREAALHRGRWVHAAMAQIAANTFDWSELEREDVIAAGYPPYVRAGQEWLNTSGFEPLLIEKRVCHPALMFAGTLDMIGRLQGALTIVDWKSGESCPWWTALQLSGYLLALPSVVDLGYDYDFSTEPHDRIGVCLSGAGRPKTAYYDGDSHFEDQDDFMCALRITRRKLQGRRPR